MNSTWQDAVVIGVVLAASAYTARKVWLRLLLNSPRCCDTCRRCSAKPNTRHLIKLNAPRTGNGD